MSDDDQPPPPSFIGHPIRWIKWWRHQPSTNAAAAVIAVAGAYAALLGLLLGGALLSALSGSVHLAGWLVAVLLIISLIIGLIAGVVVIRATYQPRLDTALAERDAARAETGTALANAELERTRREAMEPNVEAIERFGVYADYIYRALDDIVEHPEEFSAPGEAMSAAICGLPHEVIEETAGVPVSLSLWFEGNPDQRRESLPFEAVREQVREFWIPCAPDHSDREKKDFQMPIRNTWLQFARDAQDQASERSERIFSVDDLSIAGVRGRDIEMFTKHHYQAVFGATLRFGDRPGYLVVLSHTARPLSKAEERFIELLAACVNVASDLAIARGTIAI
jgi:hypothetical protein